MPDDGPAPLPPSPPIDEQTRQNIAAETFFSAFNGIYMGPAIMAAPVVAVVALRANPLELTLLVAAFPVGVFFGPLWAGLGRRLGMKRLVTLMGLGANLLLFTVFWVESSWLFTLVVAASQVLNSGMRMGQSSLYYVLYPRAIRGRVLGRLTFWTFLTMVPSILLAGWLIDLSREMYRLIYPMAGVCGLIGCCYYHMLRLPAATAPPPPKQSILDGLRNVQRVLATDRAYLLYQASFFLSGAAFFMSSHIVLLMVNERFGFSAFELSLWMTVVPQLMLAVSSPGWGIVLDRVGIIRTRILMSATMSAYLACYWLGIVGGLPVLICLGSIFCGLTNGAGQVTWALTSSHFAPRAEDVPVYNGIHFVLNGVRGLVVPWVGSVLWVLFGAGAVLAALATSAGSIPILLRLLNRSPAAAPDEAPAPAESPTPGRNGDARGTRTPVLRN
ncbi:MAG TPA: MFS transporter [Gemmataceae bacterium]